MDERIMIGIGIVLIVVGIIGAVMSGPIHLDSEAATSIGDNESAKSLKLRGNTLQYGGAGLSAIGLVLMTAGLVKGQQAQFDRL